MRKMDGASTTQRAHRSDVQTPTGVALVPAGRTPPPPTWARLSDGLPPGT